MDEQAILKKLRRGSTRALEKVIQHFSAYVVSVIHNRARGFLSAEDEEEAASDVFFALWQDADKVEPGSLRPWLGAVASHKAADLLRKKKLTAPLEDYLLPVEDSLWENALQSERAELVQEALSQLSFTDREIFYRYYDLCQSAKVIAEEMEMVPATVRSRLSRGRAVLRELLCQEGYVHED